MNRTKRFTLALSTAMMTSTIAVAPALAQGEQTPSQTPAYEAEKSQEEGGNTSQSQNPDVTTQAPSTSTTAPDIPSQNTKKSSTQEPYSTQKNSFASVKIEDKKTEARFKDGNTDFSINASWSGLDKGKQYQAQFTIKDNNGKVVADRQPENFSAKEEKGNNVFSLSLQGNIGKSRVSLEIVDKDRGVVASTDNDLEIIAKDAVKPGISTTASMDTDVIQTGSKVSDILAYEGLVPGQKYTVKTTLMCKADKKATNSEKTSEFIPEKSAGKFEVKDLEVTNADCLEQVVFETVKDEKGTVVAEHKDINDSAQTVGGDRDGKKKKKKVAPSSSPATTPSTAPTAKSNTGANATAQPTPPGDRAVIGSVPSGEFSTFGETIFQR